MRSFANLNTAVNCVFIDKTLSEFLVQPESRDIFKISLLEHYFPNAIDTNFNADLPDANMLHESSEVYRRKILNLKQQLDDNLFQEEIFIRSGVFKREIPKIYNYTCAVSGMRLDATSNISMIDACHIVPFAESYDDTITNGIALNPTIHRAFDRGLLSISDDYRVVVHAHFTENQQSPYNLRQFHGQEIVLPQDQSLHPSLENLKHHRERFL
ncbi:MAG: HNH endonuclease [Cryomorphaceae bacterium]|nr:HNH endonuclease [Cryomorphaceae bacterium]